MKKYLDLEGFEEFIRNLKIDESQTVYTEEVDSGHIDAYQFKKIHFAGETIVLYDNPYADIGIIQDSALIPIEDYIEGVFQDLEMYGEYKVFIEE